MHAVAIRWFNVREIPEGPRQKNFNSCKFHAEFEIENNEFWEEKKVYQSSSQKLTKRMFLDCFSAQGYLIFDI